LTGEPTERELWQAVPKLRALLGKALFIYGDGTQSRSIQYLEDLIGGSVLGIAWMMIEISDSESELVYDGLPEDDLKHRCALIRRTEEALGWEPRVGAREGCPRPSGGSPGS
jgi:dTDP-glucose 4,6-dehydratase